MGSITSENKGGGSDPLRKISITNPLLFTDGFPNIGRQYPNFLTKAWCNKSRRSKTIFLLSNIGLEGTACTELPDFDDSQSWAILGANYNKDFYQCPNIRQAMVMVPTYSSGVTHSLRENVKKNGGKCDHFPSWPPPNQLWPKLGEKYFGVFFCVSITFGKQWNIF